jgi:hypothetical protein
MADTATTLPLQFLLFLLRSFRILKRTVTVFPYDYCDFYKVLCDQILFELQNTLDLDSMQFEAFPNTKNILMISTIIQKQALENLQNSFPSS